MRRMSPVSLAREPLAGAELFSSLGVLVFVFFDRLPTTIPGCGIFAGPLVCIIAEFWDLVGPLLGRNRDGASSWLGGFVGISSSVGLVW